MKLTLIAATGGVGRHVLQQARADGHDVVAVVRNPSKLPPGVRAVRADLLAPEARALEEAVRGADAVVSCFGAHDKHDAGITAAGTRPVLAAMHAQGVRRIIAISAAPVSTTPSPGRPRPPRHDPGDSLLMRYVGIPLARHLAGLDGHFKDLAVMEDDLRDSGLDWTVLRPPQFSDGPLTGSYRVDFGHNPRRGRKISRADVAHYALRAIDDSATVKQAVGIAR